MIKTDRTVLLLLLNQIDDLRGEMAATTTNKVSSLSQAHFDEILVLMEYDSLFVGRFIYHWKNAAAFMS